MRMAFGGTAWVTQWGKIALATPAPEQLELKSGIREGFESYKWLMVSNTENASASHH